MNQDKIFVLKYTDKETLAVVDGAKAAASFLIENCWVDCYYKIWFYEKPGFVEIQDVFGVTGSEEISYEQLYDFCVDMLNGVYWEIYNWEFELRQVEYWTSK